MDLKGGETRVLSAQHLTFNCLQSQITGASIPFILYHQTL